MRPAAALPRVHSARGLWLAACGTLGPFAPQLAAAAAVYLGLFFGLDDFPLFDIDEGAFSEATREMLERGDFVTTYLNGQLRFDKPILIYWLQALSVSAFGVGEFGFRLPSALAASVWIGAILVFARQQADAATGYAAALLAATSLGVMAVGRGATADALLNMLLALAMFDIYRYLQQALARYRWRAFLWIGLGLLTKGPVALLIPFAVSCAVFALHGKFQLWWRAALDPLGWAILLAVAAPWYVLEYQRQGGAFLAGFFLRHNVERFLSPLHGHSGSVLYYLPAALLLLLPYSGLLLRVLPRLRTWRATPLDTFLWCWFGFVLVFFSLAGTKLPHYLMYGVTPLLVLMAMQRGALESRLLAFLPPVLLLAGVVALPHALKWFGPAIPNAYVRELLTQAGLFGRGWHLAASALLLAVLALALLPRGALWPRLALAGLLCSFAVGGLLLPVVGALQQGPVKEAALLARDAGWAVRTWHFNAPSFSVYRGAVTGHATTPRPGEVILTRSDQLHELGPLQVLYRKGGVALVRLGS
jgi:4-amino-4-deoxy-L-arabinose transferase-like glycosyltransferase